MKPSLINTIILITLTMCFSCGKNDGIDNQPTAQEQFISDISKTWDISNNGTITQDGVDVTSKFPDFKLTFGNKTYTSIGGLNLWLDGTGSWEFASSETTTEIIIDSITMSVTLTSSTITLTFTLSNSAIGGRTSSLSGNYVITVSQ